MGQPKEIPLAGKHQQCRYEKKDIAQQHDAAKPTYHHTLSLIALQHLHRGETDGTDGKHVWGPTPHQEAAACSYDHQHGPQQEYQILQLTQFLHH